MTLNDEKVIDVDLNKQMRSEYNFGKLHLRKRRTTHCVIRMQIMVMARIFMETTKCPSSVM